MTSTLPSSSEPTWATRPTRETRRRRSSPPWANASRNSSPTHLADDLPEEIGDHLTDGAAGQRLSYDEFCSRVEERTDRAAVGDPERLSRAVVETVLEHVDDETATELTERLEEVDYEGLVPEAGS